MFLFSCGSRSLYQATLLSIPLSFFHPVSSFPCLARVRPFASIPRLPPIVLSFSIYLCVFKIPPLRLGTAGEGCPHIESHINIPSKSTKGRLGVAKVSSTVCTYVRCSTVSSALFSRFLPPFRFVSSRFIFTSFSPRRGEIDVDYPSVSPSVSI